MTIKTIYDLFNFVSIDNININSFDYGPELKQNAANSKLYPQIFLEEPFRIDSTKNEIFTFNVLYLDRALNNDNSSIVECISKMHLLSNQCFEILKTALVSVRDGSITEGEKITFQQLFSDVLCGVRVEYTIIAAKDLKKCENGSKGLNFKDYINTLPTVGDEIAVNSFDVTLMEFTPNEANLDVQMTVVNESNIDFYTIQRRTSLSSFSDIATIPYDNLAGGIYNFSDIGIIANPETYTYQVVATFLDTSTLVDAVGDCIPVSPVAGEFAYLVV